MVHLSSFSLALLFSCLLLVSFDGSVVASRDTENLVESLPRHQFFINGTWTTPHSNPPEVLDVIDPSIGKTLTNIAVADQADVDRAVTAAREAFPQWSQRSFAERVALVEALAEEYEDATDDLAWLLSREMGAPIDLSQSAQVTSGLDQLELSLMAAQEFFKPIEIVDGEDQDEPSTVILKQPIGVVAMITPWNWPLNQIMLKIVPALLVGCTCVLKPSELSPLSALRLAQVFHDAGFPPGVVNVVNGDGARTGSFLSKHPEIDMISFTGSTHVGRTLQQVAAQHPKSPRLALEMGGKGAHVIFSDVLVNSMLINNKEDKDEDEEDEPDTLDEILWDAVWRVMINSGQSCNAPTRLLVQTPLYKYAVDRVAAIVDGMSSNSAHVTGPHLGPVVSRRQFEKIQAYMRSAIDEGAKLRVGGPEWPSDKPKPSAGGFYIQPTLFIDCVGTMKIMQEEVFGPVICMAPFDSEEEAIRMANDTPYGLQHYVSTHDEDRLVRFAQRLDAGMITLNGEDRAALAFFGGIKSSGNAREGGVYGLEEFIVTKAVSGLNAALVQKLHLNVGMESRGEDDDLEQDHETDEDDDEEEEGSSQSNLFMNEL